MNERIWDPFYTKVPSLNAQSGVQTGSVQLKAAISPCVNPAISPCVNPKQEYTIY